MLTGAAKNDFFTTDATGLTEDLLLAALNVLGNDPGSAHLYSLQQNLSGCGQMAKMNTAFSALGAMITINADGTIAYDASNIGSSLAHLAEGQLATDTFVYTVRMGSGALSTAKVTLQIAGENDAPTLDSITPVNILDTAVDDTPAAVTGNLSGHDVDNGAKLTYSVANPSSVDAVNHVQTMRMEYGTLTLHTDTGAYSFLADPDKIDALAEGSTAPAVFAVTVTDEHGASASQDLIFNLSGANDTAVIEGTAIGEVTEDGGQTAVGNLTVADRDAGEASFGLATGIYAGKYGAFTFEQSSGNWTYKLDNVAAQALTATDHPQEELTITSQDGTAAQKITVTVNGADEASTGGGGGTTPPTDPVMNIVIGLEQLSKTTGKFDPISNFTQNDTISFRDGISFVGKTLFDDYSYNSSVQDSMVLIVSLPTTSVEPLWTEIYLIGNTNFDNSQITL